MILTMWCCCTVEIIMYLCLWYVYYTVLNISDKAFIIYYDEDYYCEEDSIKKHPALGLCDLLRHLGIECNIDMYHSTKNINNWNQWTEQEVINCDGHIILLCSEKMHQVMKKNDNERIQMHVAHIGNITLQSLIDHQTINGQFVPVFIGKPNEQFIPTALNQRTYYTVPYEKVVEDYDISSANDVIDFEECKSLYSLVAKLTNQPEYDMPSVGGHYNGKHIQLFMYVSNVNICHAFPVLCYVVKKDEHSDKWLIMVIAILPQVPIAHTPSSM